MPLTRRHHWGIRFTNMITLVKYFFLIIAIKFYPVVRALAERIGASGFRLGPHEELA